MTLTATKPVRNEGSIIVFETAEGLLIAVDHRPASDLMDIMEAEGPVEVWVEPWAVIGQHTVNQED